MQLSLTSRQKFESQEEEDGLEESRQYVLAGFGEGTVIILIAHETVMVYDLLGGLEEKDSTKQLEGEGAHTQSNQHSEMSVKWPKFLGSLSGLFKN